MSPCFIAQPMYAKTELSSGSPVESSMREGTSSALTIDIATSTPIEVLGKEVLGKEVLGKELPEKAVPETEVLRRITSLSGSAGVAGSAVTSEALILGPLRF
ncbi:MAG TPA: hypothetical protein VLW06_07230 [Terriglobales bacterium]|nr:hypothetical protein [Terriglobales bacterium]